MMCTITEMKQRNKEMGQHYFDRDTMRFFRSKIHTAPDDRGYFITSEQFVPSEGPPAARRYSVRRFDWETGEIKTAGEFQAYSSLQLARIAIRATPD